MKSGPLPESGTSITGLATTAPRAPPPPDAQRLVNAEQIEREPLVWEDADWLAPNHYGVREAALLRTAPTAHLLSIPTSGC